MAGIQPSKTIVEPTMVFSFDKISMFIYYN